MKYKNIAISGDISTGKSTLARNLSAKLGWKHLSGGDFFRQWHKDHNVPLDEPDKVPEKLDKELDFGFQKKMTDEKHIIFESRLAGWLGKDIKEVLKVLCVTEDTIRMERMAKREGVLVAEAKKEAKTRGNLLVKKWLKLYGVKNCLDPQYFDLVVDTTIKNPQEVMEEVLTFSRLFPSTL